MARIQHDENVEQSITGKVLAGSSKDFDARDKDSFKSLFYLATFWGPTKVKTLNMKVMRSASNLKDSVFGKVTDGLPVGINAVLSGGSVVIRVDNPNAFDIDVELVRFLGG